MESIPSRDTVKFVCLKIRENTHQAGATVHRENVVHSIPEPTDIQSIPEESCVSSEYIYLCQHDLNLFLYCDPLSKILYNSDKVIQADDLYFEGIENEGVGNCFFESILDSGEIVLERLAYYQAQGGKLPKNIKNDDYFLRMDLVQECRKKLFGRVQGIRRSTRSSATARASQDDNLIDDEFVTLMHILKKYVVGDQNSESVEEYFEDYLFSMEKNKYWGDEITLFIFMILYRKTLIVYTTTANEQNYKNNLGNQLDLVVRWYNESLTQGKKIEYESQYEHLHKPINIFHHRGCWPLDNSNTRGLEPSNHYICLKPIPKNSNINFKQLREDGRIIDFPFGYDHSTVESAGKTCHSHYMLEKLRPKGAIKKNSSRVSLQKSDNK